MSSMTKKFPCRRNDPSQVLNQIQTQKGRVRKCLEARTHTISFTSSKVIYLNSQKSKSKGVLRG